MPYKFLLLMLVIYCFFLLSGCHIDKSKYPTVDTKTIVKPAGSTMVNPFDLYILNFVQRFSRKSYFIDYFLDLLGGNNLLKGALIMALYWWLWFAPNDKEENKRRIGLLLGLISGIASIFIARIVVIGLPYRERPLNNKSLHLTLPYKVSAGDFLNHSSLPSDHAVWFFALTLGLFLVNKKAGIIALIATVLITFSRVYQCYHYASDVITGALLGLLITFLCCKSSFMQKIGHRILTYSKTKPQIFYTLFFILTYELANIFGDINELLSFVVHTAQEISNHLS